MSKKQTRPKGVLRCVNTGHEFVDGKCVKCGGNQVPAPDICVPVEAVTMTAAEAARRRTTTSGVAETMPATKIPGITVQDALSMQAAVKAIYTPKRVIPVRERLPDERKSVTKKFTLPEVTEPCKKCGHTEQRLVRGYATAGFYADGRLGETFLKIDKEGSTVSGLADLVATLVSLLLQYGVPFEVPASKMIGTRFPPAGFTAEEGENAIVSATSVPDYHARWLQKHDKKVDL